MNLSNIIIQIYDNILKFNNTEIIILFDNTNSIWFSYIHILKAIGYKNIKLQKTRIDIDNKYFNTYSNILNLSSNNIKNVNIQPHTKMINESGLYLLLNKSNKLFAKQLLEKFYTEVLPSIRKTGEYKANKEDKIKLKKLTKKLYLMQKEQTMKRLTTKKYTDYKNTSGKGFLYVLNVKKLRNGKEEKCYKLGYATNLNKRLDTYKTGHPDIELVHQENVNVSKKQLEKCVLNLNIMKRLSSKNEIICNSSLEEIKSEIKDCKKIILKYSSKKQINKSKINNK
jgi:prophage antirepressor-like protein